METQRKMCFKDVTSFFARLVCFTAFSRCFTAAALKLDIYNHFRHFPALARFLLISKCFVELKVEGRGSTQMSPIKLLDDARTRVNLVL